ncbi:outer membrane beta-barrel protein [Vibrio profundum]|uniref:outer membrane protein n=1 Tax=Vibrio profundum TaxID=2910247 RepID=UPI003D13BE78
MKKLAIATIVFSAFTASHAFAETMTDNSLSDYGYIRGALGGSQNGFSKSLDPSNPTSVKETDHTAVNISTGYVHQLKDPRFAVGGEFAYNYFSNDKVNIGTNTWTIENSSLDFAGLGIWHMSEKFDAIGKAGLSYQVADASSSLSGIGGIDGENTDWVPMLGTGIAYNFEENWTADVTVTHYFGKNNINSTGKITSYMAGISYKF